MVDGVGQNLKLDDKQLEPSRHTLYVCSCVWACVGEGGRGGEGGGLDRRQPRPMSATDHDQHEAQRPSPVRSASSA